MHKNLRTFIEQLWREKEIVEISAEVDPYLELAEIHRRVVEEGGPALLFTKVKGSKFPVVSNLFGTVRRMEMAMGPKPEALIQNVVQALDKLMPPRIKTLWEERRWLFDFTRVGLRHVPANKAPVLGDSMPRVNLNELPILTSWQDDGGAFFTLPLVYTEKPGTNEHNLGMYRMQVHSENQTGMHWQIHKGGGFHHYEAEKANQAMPVTVFLGGPPAMTIAAITALPEPLPELLYASFLLGDKINLVDVPGCAHPLVAEAEFALCGEVPPGVRKPEGPFGDHYGYYSLIHDFPVFNIQRVYHRKDAIYPATVVGIPRQEDYYIGEWMQDLLSPVFPLIMPGVKTLWTYAEAGFHTLCAAIVRESYFREALAHCFRILGEGQLSLTKVLLVTDVDLNLKDFPCLLESILSRMNPTRDLIVVHDTAMDTLDYTGRKYNQGSKAILLGLGPAIRELPRDYSGGPLPGIDKIKPYCGGCLLVSGGSYTGQANLGAEIIEYGSPSLEKWPLVILVDDVDAIVNQTDFLWTVFTRFDPVLDIYAGQTMQRNAIQYQLPLVIDARMKPEYPAALTPREDIVKRVDERWSQFFSS
ncbi:MAG TPA: UbiD family decarboxylase [Syntrophomonadaceae bacterium]|nr:UbiD family decarboxylase [Syntrophomonadaceae bacterium]